MLRPPVEFALDASIAVVHQSGQIVAPTPPDGHLPRIQGQTSVQ
jgi:hypothetical protein